MAILVQSLVDQVRLESDLNSSPILADSDIAQIISDAGSDLYDTFTTANQRYNIKTFDFTMPGGVGGNVVTLPDNFQQGHSVDVNPTSSQPYTLKYLSNWLDRNSASGAICSPSSGPRQYCFVDNQLMVFPATSAGGQFRLWYVPTWTPLALPSTRSIAVTPIDGPTHVGGQYGFSLANGAFTGADVGQQLVIAWNSPNGAWSGTFVIAVINSPTSVFVVGTLPDPAGFTYQNPAGTASVISQPVGTRPDLPNQMNPWIEYLKTFASITIRNKRGQDVDAFERRLAIMKDRIQSVLQDRQEEPTQPPLLRNSGSFFGEW